MGNFFDSKYFIIKLKIVKKLFFLIVISAILLSFPSKSTKAEHQNGYKLRTVVIDPGHGGRDPGAIGVGGIKEKDVALAVALKLGSYINQYLPDVKVLYTRETDKFVALHERANIANKANADLFISIHANATNSRSANGTETFVLGLHRSAQNLEVAKRENSVILLEDNYVERYDGFDPTSPEGHIIFSLFQDAYLEQSIHFASKVEDQFENRALRRSRGVKQAGFLVLYQTTMPSVLVELGFLTNPAEARYLGSEEGQSFLASALFRAFREYKEEIEARGSHRYLADRSVPIPEDIIQNEVTQEDNPSSALAFKVQIYATQNMSDKDNAKFQNLQKFHVERAGDFYRFVVGPFNQREEASTHHKELINNGFGDAFLVPYYNGERISWQEAAKYE
ncbi:MAG: N-acetylmuramoyl-L-alanine amidase [Chitinophagaceae bacterium]|nr:MAG: N-acetylmuramoyl-L-alanine amidase [Chitinophagaceae bacterium]